MTSPTKGKKGDSQGEPKGKIGGNQNGSKHVRMTNVYKGCQKEKEKVRYDRAIRRNLGIFKSEG